MAIEDQLATSIKAFCSICGGERNCDISGSKTEKGSYEDVDWWKLWYLLQCRGCEHVFAYTITGDSEDYDIHYDENTNQPEMISNEYKQYWPAISKRKMPIWVKDISRLSHKGADDLEEALSELYGALNNDLNMLAGIGIRTCFDKASELLGINPDLSFEKKLTALVDDALIGAFDKSRLETIVDAGSASAHRGWKPTPEDLTTMMDTLEHFLETAFIVPMRVKKLDLNISKVKGKVPPKPLRPKKAKPQSQPDKSSKSSR